MTEIIVPIVLISIFLWVAYSLRKEYKNEKKEKLRQKQKDDDMTEVV